MSLDEEVGDVVLADVSVEWKIRDFFSLSDKVDDCYHSPSFSFAGSQWYLRLHPNGEIRNSSTGRLGLFLMREKTAPPKTVHCTFGIKGSDGIEGEYEFEYGFSTDEGYGFSRFCSRSNLNDRKSILMPNNVLTIACYLKSNAINTIKGEKKVLKSLLSVLESKDDSDVVIKVEGKEFPAHRVILRARSPVFRSMFNHDMVEKKSNVINIKDGDPETFQDFLVHIYSGSCEHITPKNVYSLYAAADKYDIGDLKAACAIYMKNNITVACFCDVLTLAVLHDDKELFEGATKFFLNKSVDIIKTVEWKTFQKKNWSVGNELLIKALSK